MNGTGNPLIVKFADGARAELLGLPASVGGTFLWLPEMLRVSPLPDDLGVLDGLQAIPCGGRELFIWTCVGLDGVPYRVGFEYRRGQPSRWLNWMFGKGDLGLLTSRLKIRARC